MLVHLRRSLIFAVICLVFFGFVYAFAGTGVSQVLFKSQADGSLTANGSTLIGQPWNFTKCPGHPLGSCVFQGRPDDLGPYSDTEKNNPSPAAHPGDDPLVLNGVAGESARPNLGPRSKELLKYTKELVKYWHATWRQPHARPRDDVGRGIRPGHLAAGRDCSDPDGVQGHRDLAVQALRAHRERVPTPPSWAFSGPSTSMSCD